MVKKSVKKSSVKKASRKSVKKSVSKKSGKKLFKTMRISDKKFDFVVRRLMFFGICFIIFFMLYFVTSNPFLE
ncbi:MAG: hypothetical protein OQK82_02635 [Candidatus Pacearchaeota archaeon]|nr:hypothetical protein [Candidatus Pacearchaeota archaeon]